MAGPEAGVAVPFEVDVPRAVLVDLRERLARTRYPIDVENEDWAYGTNTAYLRSLVEHWQDGFDWRAQEAAINQLPQFRVVLDDIPIHFVHQRGVGPAPLPLVLTHGWPWTFWDYRKVIGPLTDPASHGGDPADAFDVIVPSLPGYGFSTPVTVTGMNWHRTADLWARLVTEVLGHDRFVAFGADWGTAVTSQLGHKHADHVAGIHIVNGTKLDRWNAERPWDPFGSPPEGLSPEQRATYLAWSRKFSAHVSAHVLSSQTLANALHDSPAGLCSWILEKRRAWSDCEGDVEQVFSKDDLLTTMTIFWVTESFVSSVRYYREAALHPWVPSHDGSPLVQVPTSISVFRPDVPLLPSEDVLATTYDLRQFRVHDRGGHFAPAESPEVIVEDIRDGFRHLR